MVQRAERYLKVEGSSDGIRLVVSLTLGPDEAVRVLTAADADGDRVVSPEEADAYMQQWGEGLTTELPVELDGSPVRVQWGEPFLDPVGPIRRLPGSVEMIARIEASSGAHTVQLRDEMVGREDAFDRTDVAFRVRDGAQLLRSGPGPSPEGVVSSMAYGQRDSSNYVDVITAEIELPEGADGSSTDGSRGSWWVGAAAAAILLVVFVATSKRRKKQ